MFCLFGIEIQPLSDRSWLVAFAVASANTNMSIKGYTLELACSMYDASESERKVVFASAVLYL